MSQGAKIRLISDLHLGHEKMAQRRGFKSSEEHDEYLIKEWNKVVSKRDTTWILGDITMEKSDYSILDKLQGYKKIILGNHDRPQHIKTMLEYVNSVCGMSKMMFEDKRIFLTHCPIHPSEFAYRVAYNIHGHIHENTIYLEDGETIDTRYINVCPEKIGYSPKTLEELLNG